MSKSSILKHKNLYSKRFTPLKIVIPVVGLAAILAVATQTQTGRSVGKYISKSVGNAIDNAVYGQNVTSQRYLVIDYKIQSADGYSELFKMTSSNPMAMDYIRTVNEDIAEKDFPSGSIVKLPVPSNDGKTIPELFAKFNAQK